MLAQIMPGTEEYLMQNITSAYLGTDPTADSLHIGHLCGIMMLRHLQRCGHKPYLLVGGATGMIGDPSGKSQERNLLDSDTLYHNQEAIKKQVAKFLDFDGTLAKSFRLFMALSFLKESMGLYTILWESTSLKEAGAEHKHKELLSCLPLEGKVARRAG